MARFPSFLRAGLAAVALLAGGARTTSAAEAKPIDPTLLKRFEAREFRATPKEVLRYRLFVPTVKPAGTNLPLVLFLHGAAGLGDDNQRQFNGGNEVPPLALTAEEAQARFPSYVFVPQCPRGESWSGSGNAPARRIQFTLQALDVLQRELPIDPDRIYLVGVSMGGSGAWDVAARFPRRFAAVVPICGGGDPGKAPVLARLPIWCFHGASDPLVSVEFARTMITAIRKAGGSPRFTEYPGVGHDSYRNAFREPELLPWLFSQRLPASLKRGQ